MNLVVPKKEDQSYKVRGDGPVMCTRMLLRLKDRLSKESRERTTTFTVYPKT
jgi:hypothetical protein